MKEKFKDLFNTANQLATEIDVSIRLPRISHRQVHRDNYNAHSPEEYYKLSVFTPFVDHFILHLEERFLKHKNLLAKIQHILPKFIVDVDENKLNDTVDVILNQWPNVTNVCDSIVKKEALHWQQRCISSGEKQCTFIDSLNICNVKFALPYQFQSLHQSEVSLL